MTLPFRASIALVVCAAGAACSASYPTEPTSGRPVALVIQLTTPRGKVVPGTGTANQYAFTAFTIDSDNVFETVTSKATWLSSDQNVAQRRAGTASTFVAVGPGSANAIVRYEGLEATAPMLVVDPQVVPMLLPRLEVSAPSSPSLGGPTVRASALLRQTSTSGTVNATTRVEWSSADTSIATVDASGAIRAVGMGTTVITASMDGMSDWIWVSVAPPS